MLDNAAKPTLHLPSCQPPQPAPELSLGRPQEPRRGRSGGSGQLAAQAPKPGSVGAKVPEGPSRPPRPPTGGAWAATWVKAIEAATCRDLAARRWKPFGSAVRPSMPRPDFDPKTATPEQWAAFNANLTPSLRAANRRKWAFAVAGIFAKTRPEGTRKAARAWAIFDEQRWLIYRGFDAGKEKWDVIAELRELFAQ